MKPKNIEKNETEYVKGLLRKAKSEIKHLNRENKKLRKIAEKYIDLQDDLQDEEFEEKIRLKIKKCPDCGKGELVLKDLGVRIFLTCNICDYRKVENPHAKTKA
jgi:ssDNA-binding Zn-finger/Zn-ribbon topoisomerase 1